LSALPFQTPLCAENSNPTRSATVHHSKCSPGRLIGARFPIAADLSAQGCGLRSPSTLAIPSSLSPLFSGAMDYGRLVRTLNSEYFHGLRSALTADSSKPNRFCKDSPGSAQRQSTAVVAASGRGIERFDHEPSFEWEPLTGPGTLSSKSAGEIILSRLERLPTQMGFGTPTKKTSDLRSAG
jgi:hypothetical protein